MKKESYISTLLEWDEAERHKDDRACTVIALSKVMNSDYLTCYKFLASMGRKHGKGMYVSQIDKAFLSMKKTKVVTQEVIR